MICPSCGKSVEDDVAYCTYCAERLPRNSELITAQAVSAQAVRLKPPLPSARAKIIAKKAATVGALIGLAVSLNTKGHILARLIFAVILAPVFGLALGAITFAIAWALYKARQGNHQ